MEELKLTVEQEFNIRAFSEQVKSLTKEQAQEFCVVLYRQGMVKESLYKQFLMQQMGVGL